MKTKLAATALVAAMMASASAYADRGGNSNPIPWVCYGQSAVGTNATVSDPKPNNNGLVGECPGLPYTVPTGYQLWLQTYEVEGYPQVAGGIAMFPWIGKTLTNASALSSIQGGEYRGSSSATGMMYMLPAGTILNVSLQSEQQGGPWVFGWSMHGELIPTGTSY